MSGEGYKLLITEEIQYFLDSLDQKSKRIIKDNLRKLTKHPYPGSGTGDKEKLNIADEEIYRLHIGRTWTAFYIILEEKEQVRITEVMSIDEAHKKYGEI